MRSQSEDRESDRQPCAHHRRRREATRARGLIETRADGEGRSRAGNGRSPNTLFTPLAIRNAASNWQRCRPTRAGS